MKEWFTRMGYKIAYFMQGRHGNDKFNTFLTVTAYICLILGLFRIMNFMFIPALLLISYSTFRAFSKNEYARQKELRFYLKISGKVKDFFRLQKNRWKDRKTHKYLHCPSCRAVVRIKKPQKHMTVTIHCPACGKSFDKKI